MGKNIRMEESQLIVEFVKLGIFWWRGRKQGKKWEWDGDLFTVKKSRLKNISSLSGCLYHNTKQNQPPTLINLVHWTAMLS